MVSEVAGVGVRVSVCVSVNVRVCEKMGVRGVCVGVRGVRVGVRGVEVGVRGVFVMIFAKDPLTRILMLLLILVEVWLC